MYPKDKQSLWAMPFCRYPKHSNVDAQPGIKDSPNCSKYEIQTL